MIQTETNQGDNKYNTVLDVGQTLKRTQGKTWTDRCSGGAYGDGEWQQRAAAGGNVGDSGMATETTQAATWWVNSS